MTAARFLSLRLSVPRVNRVRSSNLNTSGFGLIDSLLGLLISAVLIAPVLGGIFVVIRTAPGSVNNSVISGQQATNRQNFELNLGAAQMRNDWSDATIVKTPAGFAEYLGLDCGGGGGGALSGHQTTKLLFSLQVRSSNDQYLNSLREPLLKDQGFTRIVYSLQPDGDGLNSLWRRECAVEADGKPRVRSSTNNEGSKLIHDGKINSDDHSWRLQPGVIKPPEAGSGYASTANWAPEAPEPVLRSVSTVTINSAPCNDRTVPPDATPEQLLVGGTFPPYARCDLNFTVTFGDGRTHTMRLYQGFGF